MEFNTHGIAAPMIRVSIFVLVNVRVSDTSGNKCTHAAYKKVPAEKRMERAMPVVLAVTPVASCITAYVKIAATGDDAEKISRSCSRLLIMDQASGLLNLVHECNHGGSVNSSPPTSRISLRNELLQAEGH
jgi:hypothetical protein